MNLKDVNQNQILDFYNELNFFQKRKLNKQINKIDFNFINNLFDNCYNKKDIDIKKISNLKCISNTYNDKYYKIGEEIVKKGEYAIVIMAGGNASRLGFDIPKGCLNLNINNKEVSLFELYINQLKNVHKKYNVFPYIYIMTSSLNNKSIKKFFNKNNYFSYPKEKIIFFIQNELPIVDLNGKILMKKKYEISFGPNGNGDVFNSLKKYNLINHMKDNNINYVLFSTVDNPLTNLVDYNFIGATIFNNYKVSSKCIQKKSIEDKNWIFCKYDNHPFMLPTKYLTDKINNKKVGKDYIYRDKNITYHFINIEEIEKYSNIDLKYHAAYRKNNYINKDGKYIITDKENSFKFEKFIFDAFYYSNDMLLYRVDEKEFCPIKNKEDIKKVEKIFNK